MTLPLAVALLALLVALFALVALVAVYARVRALEAGRGGRPVRLRPRSSGGPAPAAVTPRRGGAAARWSPCWTRCAPAPCATRSTSWRRAGRRATGRGRRPLRRARRPLHRPGRCRAGPHAELLADPAVRARPVRGLRAHPARAGRRRRRHPPPASSTPTPTSRPCCSTSPKDRRHEPSGRHPPRRPAAGRTPGPAASSRDPARCARAGARCCARWSSAAAAARSCRWTGCRHAAAAAGEPRRPDRSRAPPRSSRRAPRRATTRRPTTGPPPVRRGLLRRLAARQFPVQPTATTARAAYVDGRGPAHSTRLANDCEGRNAWRWKGYRCSDAMTTRSSRRHRYPHHVRGVHVRRVDDAAGGRRDAASPNVPGSGSDGPTAAAPRPGAGRVHPAFGPPGPSLRAPALGRPPAPPPPRRSCSPATGALPRGGSGRPAVPARPVAGCRGRVRQLRAALEATTRRSC